MLLQQPYRPIDRGITCLRKKYVLYITGGSDFHGEKIKPQIALATGIDHTLQIRTTLPLCPSSGKLLLDLFYFFLHGTHTGINRQLQIF